MKQKSEILIQLWNFLKKNGTRVEEVEGTLIAKKRINFTKNNRN